MAVVQIPNLPAAIALSGSEQLEAVQAGTSVRITVAQIGQALGSPASPNLSLQFNNGGVFGGSSGITTDGVARITLGDQQTTRGSLVLANTAAGAWPVTIQSSNSATAAWTMTLPPAVAAGNGFILTSNTSGVTSWTNPTALGIDLDVGSTAITNGTVSRLLFQGAGDVLQQSANLTFSSSTLTLGVAGSATGAAAFTGATSGTATITAQAAAGSPTLTLPNASGTLVSTASAPLSINATTGAISITGAAGQVLAGATPAFTATPTLGVAGTTAGTLALSGATSGTVTLQTAAVAGTGTIFQFPSSNGASGTVLTTTGSGVTTWTSPTALGIDLDVGTTAITNGTAGRVLYNNNGLLGEYSSIPVGFGGTGTPTAFTAGSIVFAGASGVYSQDNTNLFWDNSAKRLSIGANTGLSSAGTLAVAGAGYRAMNVISTDVGGVNALLAANGTTDVRIGAVSNHPLGFYQNNQFVGAFDLGGSFRVQVSSSSTTIGGSTAVIKLCNTDASTYDKNSGLEFFAGQGDIATNRIAGLYGVYTDYNVSGFSGALVLATNSLGSTTMTERMRITSAGAVNIVGGGSAGSPAVSFSGSAPVDSLVVAATTGNVGIATSTASYKLTIQNPNTGSTGLTRQIVLRTGTQTDFFRTSLLYNDGASASGMFPGFSAGLYHEHGGGFGTGNGLLVGTSPNAGPLMFGTADQERMRIDVSGNVGIGTTSPNFRLQLNSTSTNTAQYIQFTNGSTGATASDGMLCGISSANDAIVWMQESAPLRFATSNAEAMRIDSSGNVLVGTITSPTTGTQCLTIETGTAATATPADTVTFYSTDLSAGNTIPSIYTEGTDIVSANAGTTNLSNRIAVRINGTVYYLLAASSA